MSNIQKESSGFMQASAAECATIYPVILQNAKRHHNAARILGASRDYANGVAHIVLGGEELLKAVVIYLDSKELGIRQIPGIHKLFYQHVPRHNVIEMVFSALQFIQTAGEGFKKGIGGAVIGLIRGYYKGKANKSWWKTADQLKLKALYVDYTDALSDPASITEADYQSAFVRGSDLTKSVTTLINYLDSMTEKEMKDFKKSFHITDITDLLQDTIKGLHD